MEITTNIELNGNQIYDILEDAMNHLNVFDESCKIDKYVELLTSGYDDKELEVLFKRILEERGIVTKEIALPSVEDAGVIALDISDGIGNLSTQQQAFFVAGFQECIKYLNLTNNGNVEILLTKINSDNNISVSGMLNDWRKLIENQKENKNDDVWSMTPSSLPLIKFDYNKQITFDYEPYDEKSAIESTIQDNSNE